MQPEATLLRLSKAMHLHTDMQRQSNDPAIEMGLSPSDVIVVATIGLEMGYQIQIELVTPVLDF